MTTPLLQRVLTLVFLIYAFTGQAQTQTLTGFSGFYKRALTPIYEGKEVKGYSMFYRADKADKKTDNYGLDFYDQNLQKVKSVTLPKERNSAHLLRNTYNGEAFCFYFLNTKSRTLEMEVFDKALNKTATKKAIKLSNADGQMATQEMQMPSNGENKAMGGLNMYAVPGKGFIRNSYLGLMKGYQFEMYDNNLNIKWVSGSDAKADGYESVLVNEVTDKYILATIARRNGIMSKKMEFYIAAFDIETGKKILDKPAEKSSKEQLSLSSFTYDEKTNEFMAIGEFYKPDDKALVDKSQGFFIKRFGLDGKETFAKFYDWKKDINPLMPKEAKPSLEEGFVNFVHKIIRSADGRLHLVAEQYKVKADGTGIALAVLGGGTSMAKGVVANMLIYNLSPEYKLEKINFSLKDETDVSLPPGTGFFGAGMIGLVINTTGGFDYQFTQEDNNKTNFNVAYLNYKKVKKSKYREKTLVNLMSSGVTDVVTDKIDVSTTKETYSYVYPAKPGYVLVLDNEYDEKKLEMKLVKLNK